MKVYVVVAGIYSSQGVSGVYDTPERAIAAETVPGWKWTRSVREWQGRTFVSWDNDQDFSDARSIEPFDLITEGPEQPVDTERAR